MRILFVSPRTNVRTTVVMFTARRCRNVTRFKWQAHVYYLNYIRITMHLPGNIEIRDYRHKHLKPELRIIQCLNNKENIYLSNNEKSGPRVRRELECVVKWFACFKAVVWILKKVTIWLIKNLSDTVSELLFLYQW